MFNKKLVLCVLTLIFISISSYTPMFIASAAEDLSLVTLESSTVEAPPPETVPDNTAQPSSAFVPASDSAPEPDPAPSDPVSADSDQDNSVFYLILWSVGILCGLSIGRAFSFWKW